MPLPAGHYMVKPVFSSGNAVWSICSDQNACANVLTREESSPVTPHRRTMVFLRTGEGNALVQYWPTESLGRGLTAPNVEHTLMADRDKYVVY